LILIDDVVNIAPVGAVTVVVVVMDEGTKTPVMPPVKLRWAPVQGVTVECPLLRV
jgi:hypothetical protein